MKKLITLLTAGAIILSCAAAEPLKLAPDLEDSIRIKLNEQAEYVYSSKGDLELYNKDGQKKDEIRDVDDYIYIKRDKILYKSDDELYLYKNAKKQRMISSDVDDFVSYARQYGLTDIDDYLY